MMFFYYFNVKNKIYYFKIKYTSKQYSNPHRFKGECGSPRTPAPNSVTN